MAFVSSLTNDIFVSYRYADNEEDVWGQNWVTTFIKHLGVAVRQRMGGEDVKLYFDRQDAGSNRSFDDLMNEARSSAIFIAIASRAYAYSDTSWARKELDAFLGTGHAKGGLFVVEVLPLAKGETYPECLEGQTRLQFWYKAPETRTPITLSPAGQQFKYNNLLHALAEQIRNQLHELRRQAVTTPSRTAAVNRTMPVGPIAALAVLVAQTTDELADEREQVCTYLRQAGFEVLPSGDYPQGGEAFRAAVAADLKRSAAFVQLLGAPRGRRPPDLPEGYQAAQADAARQSGIPVLQWRHPALHVDTVSDEAHRRLLDGESVMVSGLESFKSEVVRRVDKPATKRRNARGTSLVYIDVDREDLDVARTICDALKSRQMAVALPLFDGSPETLRDDLIANMLESDKLVIVYGRAPVGWVHQHLRLCHRTVRQRDRGPDIVALYCAPPPMKAAVAVHLPYVTLVDCQSSADLAPLLAALEI